MVVWWLGSVLAGGLWRVGARRGTGWPAGGDYRWREAFVWLLTLVFWCFLPPPRVPFLLSLASFSISVLLHLFLLLLPSLSAPSPPVNRRVAVKPVHRDKIKVRSLSPPRSSRPSRSPSVCLHPSPCVLGPSHRRHPVRAVAVLYAYTHSCVSMARSDDEWQPVCCRSMCDKWWGCHYNKQWGEDYSVVSVPGKSRKNHVNDASYTLAAALTWTNRLKVLSFTLFFSPLHASQTCAFSTNSASNYSSKKMFTL